MLEVVRTLSVEQLDFNPQPDRWQIGNLWQMLCSTKCNPGLLRVLPLRVAYRTGGRSFHERFLYSAHSG